MLPDKLSILGIFDRFREIFPFSGPYYSSGFITVSFVISLLL